MDKEEKPQEDIEEITLEEETSPEITPSKKEKNTDTTTKQRLYFKFRSEGLNKKDAAIQSGYSPKTARNPKANIEEHKGFIKLMDAEFPDTSLAKRHKELIEQNEDKSVAAKMVVEAYKLKGKYPKGEFDADAPGVTLYFKKKEGE